MTRLDDAFSYNDLQFEEMAFEGVPVRVATPGTLYKMKKDTLCLQDRADAEALKRGFAIEE